MDWRTLGAGRDIRARSEVEEANRMLENDREPPNREILNLVEQFVSSVAVDAGDFRLVLSSSISSLQYMEAAA